eukprot:64280-Prorocentrum_minimum.AAC.3
MLGVGCHLLLVIAVRLFFPAGLPHIAMFLIGIGVEAVSDRHRDSSDRPPIDMHSIDIVLALYLQRRKEVASRGAGNVVQVKSNGNAETPFKEDAVGFDLKVA